MSSFSYRKLFKSFYDDEEIDQYTFFEDILPPSYLNIQGSARVDVQRQVSFSQINLREEIHKPEFDLNQRHPVSQRTLLHHAVIEDDVELCRELLDLRLDVNARDKDKRTPLHYAMMYFQKDILLMLLDHPKININAVDFLSKTPLNTAFYEEIFTDRDYSKEEYIRIVLLMVSKGASLTKRDIVDRTPLETIASNGCAEDVMLLAITEHKQFSWLEYLPRMKSPLRIVNRLLKKDDKLERRNTIQNQPSRADSPYSQHQLHVGLLENQQPFSTSDPSHVEIDTNELGTTTGSKESSLYLIFEDMLHRQDPNILSVLLYLNCNLESSAALHLPEADELKFYSAKVSQMIYDIFRCQSMDFPLNVQRILQPAIKINPLEPLIILQAKSFETGKVLHYCLKKQIKFIFSIPQVGNFLDDLFYSSLKREYLIICKDVSVGKTNDIFFQSKIWSFYLRSCPLATFILRFSSKVILLGLIAYVSQGYSSEFSNSYYWNNRKHKWRLSEIWLLIFTILEILYEIGQIIEENFNFKKYFEGRRNIIELATLGFIILWSFLRIKSTSINTARVVLALCAIPQAFALLRYLAIFKHLGELVLILKYILKDILAFAIVYIIWIIGFGITIFSLFHSASQFSTHGEMFLSLFEFTLNNFSFSIFDTNSTAVNIIGIIVLIIFLVGTAIILINLLIARLTIAHDRLTNKAIVEWTYAKAQTIGKNLLLKENHPFKVIPPPFNIIPVAFLPLNYYFTHYLKSNISISGTLANIEYSFILGGFVRVYGLIRFYFYRLSVKVKGSTWSYPSLKFWALLFPISIFVILIRCIVALISPLFQLHDFVETMNIEQKLDYLIEAAAFGMDLPDEPSPPRHPSNPGGLPSSPINSPGKMVFQKLPSEQDDDQIKMSAPENVSSPRNRDSLSSTRRNTLLAAKYENTVTETLYSKEEIDRILSWIRAENMDYAPDSGNPDDAFVDAPQKPSSSSKSNPPVLAPVPGMSGRSFSFLQRQASSRALEEVIAKRDMEDRLEKMEQLLLEMKSKIDNYSKPPEPSKLERTISL